MPNSATINISSPSGSHKVFLEQDVKDGQQENDQFVA